MFKDRSDRNTKLKWAGAASGAVLLACNLPNLIVPPVNAEGTPTPTGTGTPVTEASPTPIFFDATATPINPDSIMVNGLLNAGGEQPTTDHPAWINLMADESTGEAKTSVEAFKDYYLTRLLAKEAGKGNIQQSDRMFGQLSLPVADWTDRSLDFDWQNDGQGFGLGAADLNNLRTVEELQAMQYSAGKDGATVISHAGPEGLQKAWTLANANDFENVVLAYVDNLLTLRGVKNPATDQSVQAERQGIFNQIVYGDFGVREDQKDNNWQTVDDNFAVCETLTGPASIRTEQQETTKEVRFDLDQEVLLNGKEEETPSIHDSDNTVLVAMMTDGHTIRVETFDLSSPPDAQNSGLDVFSDKADARAFGGRWLPCGQSVVTVTPAPSVPGRTPRPPVNPTDTPRVIETTPVVPTVTEAATQPPQPTRTPGGDGATPIVDTPVNTPVPTQEVPPTVPPPAEPSSTPAF
jgi:hypothetical protein